MDKETFWSIIDAARAKSRGDQDRMTKALAAALKPLGPGGVAAFQHHLEARMDEAYTWPLWGAAYVMQGGCSDDMFEYFRALLVANGRDVFERAVADPDSLASAELAFGDDDMEDFGFESFLSVPAEVYEELTGGDEIPPSEIPEPSETEDPYEPKGQRWSEDGDDLARLLPKLSRKYDGGDDGD